MCAVQLQFRTQFDPASDILPEIQSQDFFHLQPVSAGTVSPFNLLDLQLRVAITRLLAVHLCPVLKNALRAI